MHEFGLFILGFSCGGVAMTWGMSIIGLGKINEAVKRQEAKR